MAISKLVSLLNGSVDLDSGNENDNDCTQKATNTY